MMPMILPPGPPRGRRTCWGWRRSPRTALPPMIQANGASTSVMPPHVATPASATIPAPSPCSPTGGVAARRRASGLGYGAGDRLLVHGCPVGRLPVWGLLGVRAARRSVGCWGWPYCGWPYGGGRRLGRAGDCRGAGRTGVLLRTVAGGLRPVSGCWYGFCWYGFGPGARAARAHRSVPSSQASRRGGQPCVDVVEDPPVHVVGAARPAPTSGQLGRRSSSSSWAPAWWRTGRPVGEPNNRGRRRPGRPARRASSRVGSGTEVRSGRRRGPRWTPGTSSTTPASTIRSSSAGSRRRTRARGVWAPERVEAGRMCSGAAQLARRAGSAAAPRARRSGTPGRVAVLPRRSSLESLKPTTPRPAYCPASRAGVRASRGAGARVRGDDDRHAEAGARRGVPDRVEHQVGERRDAAEPRAVAARVDLDLQPPAAVARRRPRRPPRPGGTRRPRCQRPTAPRRRGRWKRNQPFSSAAESRGGQSSTSWSAARCRRGRRARAASCAAWTR